MTTLLATAMTPALKWLIGLIFVAVLFGGLTGCFSPQKAALKPAKPHIVFCG